ncbi:MAG TPA: ABC transporter substrate-binding protein [Acidimicrobiia bacterium]|nr:ABC transporter substrate-binding protein [Acidimicrobiia bacterium]
MRSVRGIALVAAALLAATGWTAVADAQGTGAEKPAASEVGVSAKQIRVAVVADVDNPFAPGLFQGSVDGVEGWAKYVNKNGGIAGRKVVVDFIDSRLSADDARNAVIEACSQDFALVGTSALFLNTVSDIEGCADKAGAATGLPDLAVVTTEVTQQCSFTTYSINPPQILCDTKNEHPQTYQGNDGRVAYYRKQAGKKLHGAFVYTNDIKAAENATRSIAVPLQKGGIAVDQEVDVSSRAPQTIYTTIMRTMKDDKSNFFNNGGPFTATVAARKEAQLQGLTDPEIIWDCTLQCYDRKLLEQGGEAVERQYVQLGFVPFEEASTNRTLKAFRKFVGKDEADAFGLQAFASGVLLQQAVEQAVAADGVNAVTREALFEQLATIHDFDAGGMLGTTDVGARKNSPCFMMVQVRNGKFVRVYPKKKGSFDCKASNRRLVKLDLL